MRSIRAKLLLVYVLPTLILFGAFGWTVYRQVRRDLEAELAARLEAIAGAAAEQVRGENVIALGQHDEEGELYGILSTKLQLLAQRIGADRIYVFDLEHQSLVDSSPGVAVGDPYYELSASKTEVDQVLTDGVPRSSVLFTGKDKRLYKSGFAAVRLSPSDPTIVAGIAVEANARFFTRLAALRRSLLLVGGALLVLVVGASLIMGTFLTRPLTRVARAAERIGRGDLDTPVEKGPNDEVGTVAHALEDMRKQVRARDERMQMMLAGIAHEVRNPLAGIELFAGLLREELEHQPEPRAHVAKIERELKHLKSVVTDFVEFARRQRPDLSGCDIGEVVAGAVELLQADAQSAEVTLELSRSGATDGNVDAEQLKRAVLNLLKNAVQATPKGGRVTATVARAEGDSGALTIEVKDTGKGIAADSLNRIFTPFFTTKEKGTGLGLAFAKEIVEAHGGALTVASEPGQGTTFTITLPAQPR